jgi:hypothetical protein
MDGWMGCFTLDLGSSNGGKIRRMINVLCYALVGRLVYWGVECFLIDRCRIGMEYTFEIRGEYGWEWYLGGMGVRIMMCCSGYGLLQCGWSR